MQFTDFLDGVAAPKAEYCQVIGFRRTVKADLRDSRYRLHLFAVCPNMRSRRMWPLDLLFLLAACIPAGVRFDAFGGR